MENEQNTAELFLKEDCPFGYQCEAVDCMECMNIHIDGERRNDE